MKTADKRRIGKYLLLVLAVLAGGLLAQSCRTNEVDVPPLTGPSGHRLFLTMEAAPDHLVIHAPGRPRETSQITLQLKNQQGVGVSGENVKLRIANGDGNEINIGRLSDYNVTTDSAGFARVTYTAPDSVEQPIAVLVYVYAILTNPAYPYEVTDKHQLDLELSAVQPGTCFFNGTNAPIANFTVTPNAPVVSVPVCFDGSTTTGAAVIMGYSWNFGDGSKGTGEYVCHEYAVDGTYPVTLLVQDTNHNCDQITQAVVVGRGVPATCTIVTSPSSNIKPGDTVNFTAQITDPDGQVRKYIWDFGDGSKTTTGRNTASHKYTRSGAFNVLLTIIDDQGNISYCNASVTIVANPPVCSFTATPSSGNTPLQVNFDASGSSADTSIVQYNWDFGDGSTGAGKTVNHTYTATCAPAPCGPDSFTPVLTIVDQDGNQATCSSTQILVNNP